MNVSIPFEEYANRPSPSVPTEYLACCCNRRRRYAGLPSLCPDRWEPSAGGGVLETVVGASARFRMTPRYRASIGESFSAGVIFMAITAEDFYRSSNGD